MPVNPFTQFVHSVVAATSIPERLGIVAAVVLERVARGAGETRWYYCANKKDLESVEASLRPGSVVSFYFDDRIKHGPYSLELRAALDELISNSKTSEALVGPLRDDSSEINMYVVGGADDIDYVLPDLSSSAMVFYGPFPGRDNDGINAVTVTLPDSDGVTRAHPH